MHLCKKCLKSRIVKLLTWTSIQLAPHQTHKVQLAYQGQRIYHALKTPSSKHQIFPCWNAKSNHVRNEASCFMISTPSGHWISVTSPDKKCLNYIAPSSLLNIVKQRWCTKSKAMTCPDKRLQQQLWHHWWRKHTWLKQTSTHTCKPELTMFVSPKVYWLQKYAWQI